MELISRYTPSLQMSKSTLVNNRKKSGSEHDNSQLSKSRSLSQLYKGSYSKHQFSDNSNSSQLLM